MLPVSSAELPDEATVLGWMDELSNWGRWGDEDEAGTLNHITPSVVAAAAALVEDGHVVSCGWDIDDLPRPDRPFGGVQRHMIGTGEGLGDPERPGAAADLEPRTGGAAEWFGLVFHGYSVTHLDSLAHMFFDGRMYNDRPAAWVTSRQGATANDVRPAGRGVVTRGVLVDVARHLGVDWLDAGEPVLPDLVAATLEAQAIDVQPGDALLLRTGYGARLRQQGPDQMGQGGSPRAGWHAANLPWLHANDIAMIGADTAQDVVPSGYAFSHNPVHTVGIVAMGLWLLDNCDLEPLAVECARRERWEFMFSLAPLRIVGATGSPANPLATF